MVSIYTVRARLVGQAHRGKKGRGGEREKVTKQCQDRKSRSIGRAALVVPQKGSYSE